MDPAMIALTIYFAVHVALVAFGVGYYLGRVRTMRTRYGVGEVTDAVFRVTGAGVRTLVAILRQLEEARK